MDGKLKIDWPIYKDSNLIIGDINSPVCIATLWTPVSKVIYGLPLSAYAVAGQLYTKQGINYLLRNILARPTIRYVLVFGEDPTGSGEALLVLMKNGIGGGGRIEGVENVAIDGEIPLEAVENFRKGVEVIDFRKKSLGELHKVAQELAQEQLEPFAKPRIFPEPKISSERFPTDPSLFKIRRRTVGEAWPEVLKTILKFGYDISAVYGDRKREVLNLAVVITDEDPADPKYFDYFPFDVKAIPDYIEEFFREEKGDKSYNYGERLFNYESGHCHSEFSSESGRSRSKKMLNQVQHDEGRHEGYDQVARMIEKLKRGATDPGALAVLWQVKEDNEDVPLTLKRVPCLTSVQVQCLEDKLYLTAYFRSNDMFGAWPLNCFALRRLQADIAAAVGKKLGSLTTISHSAHIWKRDLPAAQKVIEKFGGRASCEWDPRGNLVVSIEDSIIVVKHFSPDGKPLQEFREDGKQPGAAVRLSERLVSELVISQIDHALDIGQQLANAEAAVRFGLMFKQDNPLKVGD